jgi:hypothetical protein
MKSRREFIKLVGASAAAALSLKSADHFSQAISSWSDAVHYPY